MKSAGKGGAARGGECPAEAARRGSREAAAEPLAVAPRRCPRRAMFHCIVQPRHEWPPPDIDNAFPGNRLLCLSPKNCVVVMHRYLSSSRIEVDRCSC